MWFRQQYSDNNKIISTISALAEAPEGYVAGIHLQLSWQQDNDENLSKKHRSNTLKVTVGVGVVSCAENAFNLWVSPTQSDHLMGQNDCDSNNSAARNLETPCNDAIDNKRKRN